MNMVNMHMRVTWLRPSREWAAQDGGRSMYSQSKRQAPGLRDERGHQQMRLRACAQPRQRGLGARRRGAAARVREQGAPVGQAQQRGQRRKKVVQVRDWQAVLREHAPAAQGLRLRAGCAQLAPQGRAILAGEQ